MTEKHSRPPEGAIEREKPKQLPVDVLRGNGTEAPWNEHNKYSDNFGDINDPHNDDAWTDDGSGQTKAERWLVADWDGEKYINIRFKDINAYYKRGGDIISAGRAAYKEIIEKRARGASVRELPVREASGVMTLEKFNAILTDFTSTDSLSRSEIVDWNLRQLKQGKKSEPKFKLTVAYENELAKKGKKEKVYVGTYEEIIEKFGKDLELLDSNLRVVDL